MNSLNLPPAVRSTLRYMLGKWDQMNPWMRKACILSGVLLASSVLWQGVIGPSVGLLGQAKADRLAISQPDIPTAEEKKLAAEKAAFAALKAASIQERSSTVTTPDALARLGEVAGPAFVDTSVDMASGWPQASGEWWKHLVELRLVGTWPMLMSAVDQTEALVQGSAQEFVIDRTSDGRLAMRIRWIVSSPQRDWGTTKASLVSGTPTTLRSSVSPISGGPHG